MFAPLIRKFPGLGPHRREMMGEWVGASPESSSKSIELGLEERSGALSWGFTVVNRSHDQSNS